MAGNLQKAFRAAIFPVRYPKHWEAIRALRELKGVSSGKLAPHLDALIADGLNLCERPRFQKTAFRATQAAEDVLAALYELNEALGDLPKAAHHDYNQRVYEICGVQIYTFYALDRTIQRLPALHTELRFLRLALGQIMGATLPVGTRAEPKRKVKTEFLDPITFNAMGMWSELTGKKVTMAKGLDSKGPFGPRPAKDDAFFVYLCLNVISKVDARNAITAIRRVQKKPPSLANFVDIRKVSTLLNNMHESRRKDFSSFP